MSSTHIQHGNSQPSGCAQDTSAEQISFWGDSQQQPWESADNGAIETLRDFSSFGSSGRGKLASRQKDSSTGVASTKLPRSNSESASLMQPPGLTHIASVSHWADSDTQSKPASKIPSKSANAWISSPRFLVPQLCPQEQMGNTGGSGSSRSPHSSGPQSSGSMCFRGYSELIMASDPASTDSVAPRHIPVVRQQQPDPLAKQHIKAPSQPSPEMQELVALQAELEAKLQNTQDPVQLAEAQHVLHAIHALQQAPSSQESGPRRSISQQQGPAARQQASNSPQIATPEDAKMMFNAGVVQLAAAMDVLDTMAMQERRNRYVAPWVKTQAMQDLAEAIYLIEAAQELDPAYQSRASQRTGSSKRNNPRSLAGSSFRPGLTQDGVGVTDLLADAMSIIRAAQAEEQKQGKQRSFRVSYSKPIAAQRQCEQYSAPRNNQRFESCADHLAGKSSKGAGARIELSKCDVQPSQEPGQPVKVAPMAKKAQPAKASPCTKAPQPAKAAPSAKVPEPANSAPMARKAQPSRKPQPTKAPQPAKAAPIAKVPEPANSGPLSKKAQPPKKPQPTKASPPAKALQAAKRSAAPEPSQNNPSTAAAEAPSATQACDQVEGEADLQLSMPGPPQSHVPLQAEQTGATEKQDHASSSGTELSSLSSINSLPGSIKEGDGVDDDTFNFVLSPTKGGEYE